MPFQIEESKLNELLEKRKNGTTQAQIAKELNITYATLKKYYPQLTQKSLVCKVCKIAIGTAQERGYRSSLCLVHKKEDQKNRGTKWRTAHPEYKTKWAERYKTDPEFKKKCQERAKEWYQKKKAIPHA